MRNSRRLKRMSRNRVKVEKMPLTSLMGVFTILVFFLLVNSGSVEVVEAPKDVELPESVVESKPRETVVISISPEQVLIQGRMAGTIDEILSGEMATLDNVRGHLAQLKENVIGINTAVVAESREVTILADRTVPFSVVEQVMSTCTSEGYENVSLAVIQKNSQVAAL